MTPVQLVNAIIAQLVADRDGAGSAHWPAGATVKLDPRVFFFDEVSAPAVRIYLDANGSQREEVNNGTLVKVTERIEVGLHSRVESEAEFAEFLEWGGYLLSLIQSTKAIGNWSQQRPGEWGYRHDAESLSTNATTGTVVGPAISLFLVDWSAVV